MLMMSQLTRAKSSSDGRQWQGCGNKCNTLNLRSVAGNLVAFAHWHSQEKSISAVLRLSPGAKQTPKRDPYLSG